MSSLAVELARPSASLDEVVDSLVREAGRAGRRQEVVQLARERLQDFRPYVVERSVHVLYALGVIGPDVSQAALSLLDVAQNTLTLRNARVAIALDKDSALSRLAEYPNYFSIQALCWTHGGSAGESECRRVLREYVYDWENPVFGLEEGILLLSECDPTRAALRDMYSAGSVDSRLRSVVLAALTCTAPPSEVEWIRHEAEALEEVERRSWADAVTGWGFSNPDTEEALGIYCSNESSRSNVIVPYDGEGYRPGWTGLPPANYNW